MPLSPGVKICSCSHCSQWGHLHKIKKKKERKVQKPRKVINERKKWKKKSILKVKRETQDEVQRGKRWLFFFLLVLTYYHLCYIWRFFSSTSCWKHPEMDCLLIDVHLCMYLYIYVHVYLLKQILKWNLHVWYSSKHCAISYIYLIPITTLEVDNVIIPIL